MSDAFDDTADALVRQVLAAFPADRAHGRADLERLPPPVARALAIHLDAAAERALPVSRWLDAADERLRGATDAWLDAARAAAQVPASEWSETVRTAVRQALAHLVRPVETLADAAFEGRAEAVSVQTALRRMRAVGAYDYLPEIAGRYAERKGLERIDRSGLATLLRRIDRRMVAAFGPDDWLALLGPLFAWAGPVGNPVGTVPAALLRDAFDARDADDLAEALDGDEPFSAGSLRDRLQSALSTHSPEPPASDLLPTYPPAEAPAASAIEAPAPAAPAPASVPDPVAEAPEAAMDEVRDALTVPVDTSAERRPAPPVPVLHVDDADLPPDNGVPPAAADTETEDHRSAPVVEPDETPLWQRMLIRPAAPASAPTPEDDETPLWRRFAQSDLASQPPDAAGAPSLGPVEPAPDDAPPNPALDAVEQRVLGPGARDRRAWFVAALFEGSVAEYHRTLDRIGRAASYTDATHVISDEVLRRHHVDPYTDPAIAFIDAVQERFDDR